MRFWSARVKPEGLGVRERSEKLKTAGVAGVRGGRFRER